MNPHFPALYGAARRLTLSIQDAEDLVQEVCIKAFARLEELEGIEFPRAWLLKVTYNLFVDGTRRAARSPLDHAGSDSETSEPDRIAADIAGPEELCDRELSMQRILRAMRCLSADHCALIAMHDIEGLSIDELSGLTGMPTGTIKAQLFRTRAKLGRLLSNAAVTKPRLKVVGGRA